MRSKVLIRVDECARCGRNHSQVVFKKLRRPILERYTYWGMCPRANQPIIMAPIGNIPVMIEGKARR